MTDQAQGLRKLLHQKHSLATKQPRIITVTSGKGGVGKSNFTLNFALSLQQEGYRVLVFDADIGMANIDVLMGVHPPFSLYHLIKRQKSLRDIICFGQNGLMFIAGGSGFHDMLNLSEADLEYFSEEINQLNGDVDFVLFDTGAGLSKETLNFILAAQETIIVTTPEPTSITDAYAVIKMASQMDNEIDFKLVVNRVSNQKEGRHTADKITMVARQFLDVEVSTLGFVSDDSHVVKAVKKQIPFTIAYPNCAASRNIRELTYVFLRQRKARNQQASGIGGFLRRMVNALK